MLLLGHWCAWRSRGRRRGGASAGGISRPGVRVQVYYFRCTKSVQFSVARGRVFSGRLNCRRRHIRHSRLALRGLLRRCNRGYIYIRCNSVRAGVDSCGRAGLSGSGDDLLGRSHRVRPVGKLLIQSGQGLRKRSVVRRYAECADVHGRPSHV